jgi:hypothetical protein
MENWKILQAKTILSGIVFFAIKKITPIAKDIV